MTVKSQGQPRPNRKSVPCGLALAARRRARALMSPNRPVQIPHPSAGYRASKRTLGLCIGVFALVFLSETVRADGPVSPCVNALEQIATLQTPLPVYKLVGPDSRRFIDDADRSAEIVRFQKIIGASCSTDLEARKSEQAEASRLHTARSVYCANARDDLSRMEQKDSRDVYSSDVVANQRRLVTEDCPTVPTYNVWLVARGPPPQT